MCWNPLTNGSVWLQLKPSSVKSKSWLTEQILQSVKFLHNWWCQTLSCLRMRPTCTTLEAVSVYSLFFISDKRSSITENPLVSEPHGTFPYTDQKTQKCVWVHHNHHTDGFILLSHTILMLWYCKWYFLSLWLRRRITKGLHPALDLILLRPSDVLLCPWAINFTLLAWSEGS